MPAIPARQQHDAARLADREGAAGVLAEVELLDGHRVRLVLGDQVADARVDAGQPALSGWLERGLDHAAVERRQLRPRARTTP